MSRRASALGVLVLAAAPATAAQFPIEEPVGRYGSLYGRPTAADVQDIAAGMQNRRSVRTRGRLDVLDYQSHYYLLRDEGAEILLLAVEEIADEVRRLIGREVEVSGYVRQVPERQGYSRNCGSDSKCEDPYLPGLPDRGDNMRLPTMSITVWSGDEVVESSTKRGQEAPVLTLESLLTNPGRRDGQTVRVVGKFRGHNLYGDLPTGSRRRSADWVIKDDVFAVWVTGKKPKGSGWELDASLKRDTGKWVEVVGRPMTRRGVVYLEALRVSLGKPPSPTADAQPPPPPPPRPKVAPVVVFALPLDGEADVPPETTRLLVQFSKDMDESTFEGRVELRYMDGARPGERPFDAVKLSYDRGRRVLSVDPGDVLREGRHLELLLLPGIRDTDGLELAPLRPSQVEGAVAVLRWMIAG